MIKECGLWNFASRIEAVFSKITQKTGSIVVVTGETWKKQDTCPVLKVKKCQGTTTSLRPSTRFSASATATLSAGKMLMVRR